MENLTTIKKFTKILANAAILYMAFLSFIYYPTDIELTPSQVEKVKAFTARIYTTRTRASGVIYKTKSNKAFIITNAHVCLSSSYADLDNGIITTYPNFSIDRGNGNKVYGTYYDIDIQNDICAISLSKHWNAYFKAIKLSDSPPHVFDKFYQASIHPKYNSFHLQAGKYVRKDILIDKLTRYHKDSWIISTPIVKGMSGSAMFNNNLELIGLVWGTSHLPRTGIAVGYGALSKFLKGLE